MTTKYLSKEHIIAIHHELIERFGGLHGIRDESLLESAIGRYQSGYYADSVEEAAALMESLGGNHPFLDGNKRIAVTAPFVFLMSNGYEVLLDEKAAFDFINDLFETHEFSFARLEPWMRRHIKLHTGAVKDSLNEANNIEEYPDMSFLMQAIEKLSTSIEEMDFLLGQRTQEVSLLENIQKDSNPLLAVEFGIKWMKSVAADISFYSDRLAEYGDDFLMSWATIAQWIEDKVSIMQPIDRLNKLSNLFKEFSRIIMAFRNTMSANAKIIQSTASMFDGIRQSVDAIPASHKKLSEQILKTLEDYKNSMERHANSHRSLDEQLTITMDSCNRLVKLLTLRLGELK